eukprot:CAMPEP_0171026756 /NCGR_PEP_ID=MMETSP0736-20130129/34517_1 /TAXON_ID=186038 /ORGANISM="Fragilariopsis kerguelensis, Strain L26-C5" /LENGTH=198 /DNA_ID=CAMNT_0011467443 /DNA_START=117 /DNA_END=710 /DNA_ORIENTATION=+
MNMNLLVALIAIVSVSARDQGLRGQHRNEERELTAASVYDYNGYGGTVGGDAGYYDYGYGAGDAGVRVPLQPVFGVEPNFVPADLPRGGVGPNFVPADLPRGGVGPNFVPAELPRGGVGPNFVPADLPRRPPNGFEPNFVPADLPRFTLPPFSRGSAGGVSGSYTGLAGYNDGYNSGYGGGVRGGVGPNFVPADLPRG